MADVEIVGTAESSVRALRLIGAVTPDVVVIEPLLPDGSGVDLCRVIRARWPGIRCVFLAASDDHRALARHSGASGFVLKSQRTHGMIAAIHAAAVGHSWVVGPVPTETPVSDARKRYDDLGYRERRILDLIAEGNTNEQIAADMGIAPKTVKNYISALFSTLGVERRTQAAVFRTRLGYEGLG